MFEVRQMKANNITANTIATTTRAWIDLQYQPGSTINLSIDLLRTNQGTGSMSRNTTTIVIPSFTQPPFIASEQVQISTVFINSGISL